MTAFICELGAERINLLTDGAMYTPDGVLAAVVVKAVELPQRNAAFVVRGLNLISFELAKFFPRLSGFDNLIAVAADTLPKVREWALEGTTDWEVLIAGFSEAGPEMHFYKSSFNDGLRRMDGDFLIAGPQVLEGAPVNFDVYQHGIPALEAMRLVDDENGYRIGGLIAHTAITRDSVSTQIIHRWPDVIGERIESHGLVLGGAQSRVQIVSARAKG
jgi:hypothetical protein